MPALLKQDACFFKAENKMSAFCKANSKMLAFCKWMAAFGDSWVHHASTEILWDKYYIACPFLHAVVCIIAHGFHGFQRCDMS